MATKSKRLIISILVVSILSITASTILISQYTPPGKKFYDVQSQYNLYLQFGDAVFDDDFIYSCGTCINYSSNPIAHSYWIMKAKSSGGIEWFWDVPTQYDNSLLGIYVDTDAVYACGCTYKENYYHYQYFLIVKLAKDGTELWTKEWLVSTYGGRLNKICKIGDNFFAVGEKSDDGYVVRFKENGSVTWSGYVTTSKMSDFVDVDTDGTNLFVTGPSSYSGNGDFFVAALSPISLSLIWEHNLENNSYTYSSAVSVINSSVFVTGFRSSHFTNGSGYTTTRSEMVVTKWTTSGVKEWNITIGGFTDDVVGIDVQANGGFVYACGVEEYEKPILIKINSTSSVVEWTRIWDSNYIRYFKIVSMDTTAVRLCGMESGVVFLQTTSKDNVMLFLDWEFTNGQLNTIIVVVLLIITGVAIFICYGVIHAYKQKKSIRIHLGSHNFKSMHKTGYIGALLNVLCSTPWLPLDLFYVYEMVINNGPFIPYENPVLTAISTVLYNVSTLITILQFFSLGLIIWAGYKHGFKSLTIMATIVIASKAFFLILSLIQISSLGISYTVYRTINNLASLFSPIGFFGIGLIAIWNNKKLTGWITTIFAIITIIINIASCLYSIPGLIQPINQKMWDFLYIMNYVCALVLPIMPYIAILRLEPRVNSSWGDKLDKIQARKLARYMTIAAVVISGLVLIPLPIFSFISVYSYRFLSTSWNIYVYLWGGYDTSSGNIVYLGNNWFVISIIYFTGIAILLLTSIKLDMGFPRSWKRRFHFGILGSLVLGAVPVLVIVLYAMNSVIFNFPWHYTSYLSLTPQFAPYLLWQIVLFIWIARFIPDMPGIYSWGQRKMALVHEKIQKYKKRDLGEKANKN